jgi:hypothetical protein
MSEHTPGPWIRHDYRIFKEWPGPDLQEIGATAWNAKGRTPEAEANAALMAAAPDLLEAAITALAYLETNPPPAAEEEMPIGQGSFYIKSVRELTEAVEKTRAR